MFSGYMGVLLENRTFFCLILGAIFLGWVLLFPYG